MWHRLPFEREAAAGRLRAARRRRGAAGASGSRFPPARATLGVDRERACRSAGTTSFRRCSVAGAGVRDRAPRRHQRALSRVRRRRRLPRSAVVAAGGLGVGAGARRSRIRCSGSATATRGAGAACSSCVPLPTAWPVYVSQAEASAYARWRGARLPTEAEFQRAAYGIARRRAPSSVGRRAARRDATASSISRAGIPSRPAAIRRARARGASTISSATAGSGRSTPFAPFPGFQRDAVVSGVLGRLLRRRALRDEGRVAGDGARTAAADVPQLVPRRGIRTSMRPSAARPSRSLAPPPSSTASRRDVRRATSQYYLTLPPRQLPSRYFYDALGSALFEAICRAAVVRHHARRDARCSRAHGREILAPPRRSATIVELGPGSGDKLATLLVGAPPAAARARLCTWSTSRRARSTHATRTLPRRCRAVDVVHARGDLRGRPGRGDRAQPRPPGATLVLFLGSNIGNFDPPGADAFLRGVRAALAAGDALLIGADLVKPESRAAARLRRSARRHRRVQPQPAGPHQPRARRRLRPRRASRHRARLERRGVARRDAPGQPSARSSVRVPGAGARGHASRPARRSGPRAPTSTSPTASSRCSAAPASRVSISGSTRTQGFALTLVEAR